MYTLRSISSAIATHWKPGAVIASALGIALACRWCLETDQARLQRVERNRIKELRRLADRISTYGSELHQCFPIGNVVISDCDLGELFRKPPEIISAAMKILLSEQKIQKISLNGYWKLTL
jgi:hypothetical protein